ncbi:MAG: hypothetical protein ACTSSR_08385, partial [Alphaproteobacteria bacterium]
GQFSDWRFASEDEVLDQARRKAVKGDRTIALKSEPLIERGLSEKDAASCALSLEKRQTAPH